ncbi:BadF/BadG/BcrA/BcrD ATPase family protein [Oceaniovalibus guishaninsula JLT2003]|uniref:BadF/BadG/BcrA/BcrD ATPase family protein n=1 Tax=Oceaniovalibus guishaninsula JLT2003 TaxID=1231392 RepID=K2GP79_9RHOB|nr:BadF/BadG/BcrA/BcrD ATPase family protein [Oceaniovalibus guishaninsula]EKE44496.1 BadF/BadG/BcrA/BcrD ATPase family protein [Oceaniovalibus guishaninsula JLT2003]
MGRIYLGVDGGGTGCRAAFWDTEGRRLGTGLAGPANLTTDFDAGIANVRAAIAAAARDAGLSDDDARGAVCHAGLAGVQSPQTAARAAAALPCTRARVDEDRGIVIAGALGPQGDGTVLAIGTGSFAGRRQDGAVRSVGGWGLRLGDCASGAWLGRAALSATLEAADGMRDPSPLTDALLARMGGTPQGLVAFAATAQPADLGALAPEVMRAAADGDATARGIVAEGAAWMERALAALGHAADDPLCLTGGLGPLYRAALDRDGRRFVPPLGTPLDGALILARAYAEG